MTNSLQASAGLATLDVEIPDRVRSYTFITSSPPRTSSDELCEKLSWMTLRDRRRFHILCKVHRCAPEYLCKKFIMNPGRTRRFGTVYLQRPQTEFYRSFEYGGGMMWNNLPCHLHEMNSFLTFKRTLYNFIVQKKSLSFVFVFLLFCL